MTPYIFAVFALWILQSTLGSSMRFLRAPGGPAQGLGLALGARDAPPEMPVLGARAARAFANLSEALPVFLGLALLIELHSGAGGLATAGALVFLVARVVYVPAYLSGVPGVRTAAWAVGHLGLGIMAAAAWSAAT